MGGRYDGQWLDMKDPPPAIWKIASPVMNPNFSRYSISFLHSFDVYRLERLETSCETKQAQVHSLYVHDTMTVAQMVDALIKGYVGHRI
jgi:hypothetical protein